MSRKPSRLEIARKKAEEAVERTNRKIEELGENTKPLFDTLTEIQKLFDAIRNIPEDSKIQYERVKTTRLKWKEQTEKIESDYRKAAAQGAAKGAAGASMGVAVAALGPSAAMGIATTFGVASTGTAISTLSGAAATNAALAWLGGGALAVGGGGMAAGETFLTMTGPIGWAIAGTALLATVGFAMINKNQKDRLDNIFSLISERDAKSYDLATVELNERIARIKEETNMLRDAIAQILLFGTDYEQMTEEQKYKLGAYLNLMNSSVQLLVNPIRGLQPKYSDDDFNDFIKYVDTHPPYAMIIGEKARIESYKSIIMWLANLVFKIEMDERDKEILMTSLKKNKKLREKLGISKKAFSKSENIFDLVDTALWLKYNS